MLVDGHVHIGKSTRLQIDADGELLVRRADALGIDKICCTDLTALFYDMKLIGAAGLDLAVLPIGDRFTMGVDDSIEAIKLLEPRKVAPSHYDTWPPIAQDANAWAERVRKETRAEPVVVQPGGKMVI